jgi:DNA-binding transcriptional LysR family regulator
MRNLAWDDVRLVREIARSAGMAGAAAALGIDNSTVFRRLGALEAALGTKLFERRRSGYVLTPAGEDMVRMSERFEQDIADFSRRLEGGEIAARGEIRVATADSLLAFLMTDLLARFRAVYPQIILDVVIGNTALNLSRRDADVAIRATDRPPENLVGRRIGTIAWALYGRHAEHGETADAESRVEAGDWVVLADEMAGLNVVRWAHAHVPAERLVYKANTVLGLAAAVEAGIGIGHLPCFIGDQNRALMRLSPPEPDFSAGLWLLTHPDLRKSPRIRAFLDFMGAELQRLKPLLEGMRMADLDSREAAEEAGA